jgi:tryptophan halogenase
MSGAPRHVVAVGRDADLWLTVTALRQALRPTGVEVTAIELPTRLGPASSYATLPAIESLHSRLGLEEAAMLRSTGGSFSLGYNVVVPGGAPFLLAHGSYGAPIEGAEFFPLWLKARRFGLNASLEDFSPTAMAARHRRMLLPDEETETFGRTDYAYHLPAIAYASLLKSHAQRLGVAIHHTVQVGIERDSDTGFIRAITPRTGPEIAGDLFIDATGPEAILIGGALGVSSEDWGAFFPFDRRLTARAERFRSVPCYAELRVSPGSWTALYGNQTATHVVRSYRLEDETDKVAVAAAIAESGMALGDITIASFAPSVRTAAWSGNCIAIGGSACALDPVFDLDLHSIQLGIVHLLSLFPTTPNGDAERSEYNRVARSLFDRLRDFQAALYAPIGASRPESLAHKIGIFAARGAIAPMEDETFSTDQWRALFVGIGLSPDSWSPAIDVTPPERMKEGFRRILEFVGSKVVEQPTQDQYLAEIGADRAP